MKASAAVHCALLVLGRGNGPCCLSAVLKQLIEHLGKNCRSQSFIELPGEDAYQTP